MTTWIQHEHNLYFFASQWPISKVKKMSVQPAMLNKTLCRINSDGQVLNSFCNGERVRGGQQI